MKKDVQSSCFQRLRLSKLSHSWYIWLEGYDLTKRPLKKCTRQSRKVLRVVWSSLFFKEKFARMALEAMDLCSRLLKESNKGKFDSYSVRNSVLIISRITFGIVACTFFPTAFLQIAVCVLSASPPGRSSFIVDLKWNFSLLNALSLKDLSADEWQSYVP